LQKWFEWIWNLEGKLSVAIEKVLELFQNLFNRWDSISNICHTCGIGVFFSMVEYCFKSYVVSFSKLALLIEIHHFSRRISKNMFQMCFTLA